VEHGRGVFQFLIGSLKTLVGLIAVFLLSWFQFLIGSLKTKAAFFNSQPPLHVSIPYR